MMAVQLPDAGAASQELARKAHQWWMESAKKEGIDLSTFDPASPLPVRLAWAQSFGLDIASVLSRYSSKMQHSTESQVQHNVFFAPRHRLYTPPEYLCIDEGEKGRRQNRDGLERVKAILKARSVHVLLVFKISRLLRVGYKGFQFVNEEVVEEGLRAISTSQGIDTNDEKTWKGLMYLHGMMDDMLLDTIADHCRAGLTSLFLEGYVTGALPVGYESEEVPGAPLTNRGLPRKRPAVNANVAEMINDHYRRIRDGMPLREGLRRWLADGGPYDPRSTLKHMSYPAYRRMLSNRRYTGLWAFGRKRNRWSSKRDYTMQVEQSETEVKLLRCEELRIVEDDLFFDVQSILNKKKRGPQGPRKKKQIQLWDLVAENFFCAACSTEKQLVRFHQAGANNRGMRCKRGMHCPCNTTVRRKEAVLAVCSVLAEHVQRDEQLVLGAVDAAVKMDARGDLEVERQKEQLARQVKTVSAQIDDFYELAGQGTERDRAELKTRIRSAQAQRTTLLGEISRLERRLAGTSNSLTPDMAGSIVGDMKDLLQRAAAGELGEDSVYRVLSVFRRLVNETIMVHVEQRPARKETNVRGVFRLHLLETIRSESDQTLVPGNSFGPEISVWLREPPQIDRLAPRVHQLIDVEGHSYRGAAKVLQAEGYNINSGVVWQIYRRYYEMIGEPVPKRPYNNGNKRKSA